MEKGETTPKGDSLKKNAKALETTTENLLETDKREDLGLLALIVISGISYLIHPFLGILLPLILWFIKRNKIVNADIAGKRVINFQITWQILFFTFFVVIVYEGHPYIPYNLGISEWTIDVISKMNNKIIKVSTLVFYLLNLALTLFNLIRIRNEKLPRFFISIPFL